MPKIRDRRNEGARVIRDRAASGKAKPGHNGGTGVSGWSLPPLGICDYDGPETIRLRKYATGTHVLLQEIGVETEATPREVVWTKNKARLYRYRRADGGGGKSWRVPVLMIYGFVLKPYVLDLVPGNSLVEYLVQEGFDVYLLDFGISGLEDAGLSLEDFVLDYMCGAVRTVLQTSGAEEISLFGHSQGIRPAKSGLPRALDAREPQRRVILRTGYSAEVVREPTDGPCEPAHQLGGLPAGRRRRYGRPAVQLRRLRHGVAGGRGVGRARRHRAFMVGGEQVGRRRRAVPRRDIPKVGEGFLPGQQARQGEGNAPWEQSEPLEHQVRRTQRFG